MCLHVTFTDGSNPYIIYGNIETVSKKWAWYKKHVKTARCCFLGNNLQCMESAGGGYSVARYFDGAHKTKHYTYLKSALKALQ